MNLRIFSITIGVLSFLLVCINYIPVPYDIFVITDDNIRSLIDQLPIEQKASLKVAHALHTSRYDIGLFGNSRIEMIGQQHIGEQHGQLFNFSLSQSSFRQSVKLLKKLADQNRAPRISIICLDHVGLDMHKGDGVYPIFPYRLLLRAKEISYLARSDSISKTNLVQLIYSTFSS